MGISFGDVIGGASNAAPDIASQAIQSSRAEKAAGKAQKKSLAIQARNAEGEEEKAPEDEEQRRRRLAIATVATSEQGAVRPTTARSRLLGA